MLVNLCCLLIFLCHKRSVWVIYGSLDITHSHTYLSMLSVDHKGWLDECASACAWIRTPTKRYIGGSCWIWLHLYTIEDCLIGHSTEMCVVTEVPVSGQAGRV